MVLSLLIGLIQGSNVFSADEIELFRNVHIKGSVCLVWDANTEPDLAGYRIYSGNVSRMSDKLEKIQQWCEVHEPTNDECIVEWEAICTEPLDKQCHSLLYEYDSMVDVSDVTEYTLTGLDEGKTYYFAATAYDEDDNESPYSEELIYSWHKKPNAAGKGKIKVSSRE